MSHQQPAADGQLLFLLGNGPTLYSGSDTEELSPLLFQVTANYMAGSELISETSTVDLRPYINTDIQYDPIVEELGKLREEFVRLSRSLEKNLSDR